MEVFYGLTLAVILIVTQTEIMKITLKYLLSILLITCLSCSNEAESPKCEITSITMKIDGQLQSFEPTGYGIDLTDDGHRLSIWFGRYNTNPLREQNFLLTMRYKKTGANKIESLIYSENQLGSSVSGNLVNENFVSNVRINRSSCFVATFSGKINSGNQEVNFTDAKVSYEYEEPLGEQ